MKLYTIYSLFHTIQGEGIHSGKRAVFVRFAGCNLWSGREQDRATAVCKFCDTEFRGGQRYTLDELVEAICAYPTDFVVFTGGEPGLQLDAALVKALQRRCRYVAVETNGTTRIPDAVDWVCVSPKAGTQIVTDYADEVKLVFPQVGMEPWLAKMNTRAKHYWLSPMDGPEFAQNVAQAVEFVKLDCGWRLNIQAHKVWACDPQTLPPNSIRETK